MQCDKKFSTINQGEWYGWLVHSTALEHWFTEHWPANFPCPVNRTVHPLPVSQPGQLSLTSFGVEKLSSKLISDVCSRGASWWMLTGYSWVQIKWSLSAVCVGSLRPCKTLLLLVVQQYGSQKWLSCLDCWYTGAQLEENDTISHWLSTWGNISSFDWQTCGKRSPHFHRWLGRIWKVDWVWLWAFHCRSLVSVQSQIHQ